MERSMKRRRAERSSCLLAPVDRGPQFVAPFLLAVLLHSLAHSDDGELLQRIPIDTLSPQDITYDEQSDTFWMSFFLDGSVRQFSADLTEQLATYASPLGPNSFATGLTYDSLNDTLWLTDALRGDLVELNKFGDATGRTITPKFLSRHDGSTNHFVRGMAFDRTGDNGHGSIWFVEVLGTLLYEIALTGETLRTISHPDDRDGFPGAGLQAPASDIDLIYEDGALAGVYITGGRMRVDTVRRLNLNGEYEGLAIPLIEAAGSVSAILQRPFVDPDTGAVTNAFLCVVESNAEFALISADEPDVREITGFRCTARSNDVSAAWNTFMPYDRIEVWNGCELIATLAGSATEWQGQLEHPGEYELTLMAHAGERVIESRPCLVVVGAGQVRALHPIVSTAPRDIATNAGPDGDGSLIFVTDARTRTLEVLDYFDFGPFTTLEFPEEFLDEQDFLSGVAHDPNRSATYLVNASTWTVGELDDVGVLARTFPLALPNLEDDPEEEPNLGFVSGLTFDPAGDDGLGSLWLTEVATDTVYEVDLDGNILSSFPHPFLEIEAPPEGVPGAISSGGIALDPRSHNGTEATELMLSGGTWTSGAQGWIVCVDKRNGRLVPGSSISLRGISDATRTSGVSIAPYRGQLDREDPEGAFSLLTLPLSVRVAVLAELELETPPAPALTFLSARQVGYRDETTLSFTHPGGLDAIEIYRDCEKISELAGDANLFVDRSAPLGPNEYAIRGKTTAGTGPFVRASVHLGPGAVLVRHPLWPTDGPQSLAVDPIDGTHHVSANRIGDERTIFRYDANFRFLDARESTVERPWQISALSIRTTETGDRWLYSIAWMQPVPFETIGSERFLLVAETMRGERVGFEEIFPPRPTNGFITYPTALTWDATSDTFYYLGRNAKTFVQMSTIGETIREFPHPSPPFQNFVFNLGLSADPDRGTLFITGSNRFDLSVSKAMEMTFDGVLTGVEIPLAPSDTVITGIHVRGTDLVGVGRRRGRPEIVRIKAFAAMPQPFIRGDTDANGTVNITDVLNILNHLFIGAARPTCADTADTDDDGIINLTDAVVLLRHLFAGGAEPAEPWNSADVDPTPDGLPCGVVAQ